MTVVSGALADLGRGDNGLQFRDAAHLESTLTELAANGALVRHSFTLTAPHRC